MNVRFVVIAPESKKGIFTVRLPIVVGRSEEAKFRIQQDRVSRKHCEFFDHEGVVYLRDLGSTNGTFLDDEQVPASQKTLVASGGVVRVGGLEFRVEYNMPAGMEAKVGGGKPKSADDTIGLKQGGDSEPLLVEHDTQNATAGVATADADAEEAMFEESVGEEPAAEAPGEAVEPEQQEPADEKPKQKVKSFDFLAPGPPAEEEADTAPQWPAGDDDAGEPPPDDEKLGDFFKGLK
jgi:predicted component of type VI protein secretion system